MAAGQKRKRAPSKTAAASSVAPTDNAAAARAELELAQLTTRKLNENFRLLSSEESHIMCDPSNGLTLRARIYRDLKLKRDGAQG